MYREKDRQTYKDRDNRQINIHTEEQKDR